MAYTFLKAQGFEIGTSLCELEKVELAKSLLEQAQGKIVLPIDFAFTSKFANEPASHVGPITDIKADEMSLDIGPKSIEMFADILKTAKLSFGTDLWAYLKCQIMLKVRSVFAMRSLN